MLKLLYIGAVKLFIICRRFIEKKTVPNYFQVIAFRRMVMLGDFVIIFVCFPKLKVTTLKLYISPPLIKKQNKMKQTELGKVFLLILLLASKTVSI
jgi:hypothetical protein